MVRYLREVCVLLSDAHARQHIFEGLLLYLTVLSAPSLPLCSITFAQVHIDPSQLPCSSPEPFIQQTCVRIDHNAPRTATGLCIVPYCAFIHKPVSQVTEAGLAYLIIGGFVVAVGIR